MGMHQLSDGIDSRRTYLKAKILHDHLQQVAHKRKDSAVLDGLTYASAISLLDDPCSDTPQHDTETHPGNIGKQPLAPGGLSEIDLRRFSRVSAPVSSNVFYIMLSAVYRSSDASAVRN